MIKSALIYFINEKKDQYKKNTSKNNKEIIYELTKMYWELSPLEKQKYKDLEKIKI